MDGKKPQASHEGASGNTRAGECSPLPASPPSALEALVNFVLELLGLGIRHPHLFAAGPLSLALCSSSGKWASLRRRLPPRIVVFGGLMCGKLLEHYLPRGYFTNLLSNK